MHSLSFVCIYQNISVQGVQATLCCKSTELFTVPPPQLTSTPVKAPPLQDLEEEDEPTLEASSSPVAPEDTTYDPAKSVTDLTVSTDIS